MAFQDPAQKLYTPLDEVMPCAYHHGRMPCPANAFKYDEDPQKPGEFLCREHRTWTWLGAWESQLWSLRITPKPNDAWWLWCGQHLNKYAWNERMQGWDINLVMREIKRHGNQKLELVLPTTDWLLKWAKREENKRIEQQVQEARRRLG
jgi:hypothetical protein